MLVQVFITEVCHQHCDDCIGPTNADCTQCKNSFLYSQTNECLTTCPDGLYNNLLTLTCQVCHQLCATCTSSNSISDCTSCSSLAVQYNGMCFDTCPQGTYSNNSSSCEACHPNCNTCSANASNCQSCVSGYYLYNSFCYETCPDPYYGQEATNECKLCHEYCTSCFGSSSLQCTQCDEPTYVLSGTKCTNRECYEGFYLNSVSHFCEPCNSVCQSCSGPTEYDCYYCAANHIFYQNACRECDQVSGLMNNFFRKQSDTSGCLEICGDGFNFGINECDDGNLSDYDGCKSDCTVEYGFKCEGGTYTSPDICSDIIPPSIEHLSLSKAVTQLTVVFDQPIKKSKELQNADFQLTMVRSNKPIKFNFQVQPELNSSFQEIKFSIKIEEGLTGDGSQLLFFLIRNPSDFRDISGNEILLNEGNLVLPYFFYLSYRKLFFLIVEQQAILQYSNTFMGSSSIIGLGINVLLSIFLGASLEAMWNLINTIQLLNFLPLTSVYIPDQMLEMYKLLSFVNGDLDILEELYHEYLIKPMDLKEEAFNERFQTFGFDSARLISLSGVNLLFWFILLTLILFASILSLFKCSKVSKRMQIPSKLGLSVFRQLLVVFSGMALIVFFLSLFLTCILLLFQISLMYGSFFIVQITFSNNYEIFSYLLSLLILIFFTIFPFFTLFIVSKNIIQLYHQKMLNSYGSLYQTLSLSHHNRCRLYFFPLFIFRRLLFVVSLVLLTHYPLIQLLVINLTSVCFFIWIIVVKPMKERKDQCLLIFSESCFLCVCALTTCFYFLPLSYSQFKIIGWVAVGVVLICFVVNMGVIYPHNFKVMFKSLRQKCRKNKKEIYRKREEERKQREENITSRLEQMNRLRERERKANSKRRFKKEGFFSDNIFEIAQHIDDKLARGEPTDVSSRIFNKD